MYILALAVVNGSKFPISFLAFCSDSWSSKSNLYSVRYGKNSLEYPLNLSVSILLSGLIKFSISCLAADGFLPAFS